MTTTGPTPPDVEEGRPVAIVEPAGDDFQGGVDKIMAEQTHPDATRNIVKTIVKEPCPLRILKVLLLLVLCSWIIALSLAMLPITLLIWCTVARWCPGCLGIVKKDAHNPDWMLEGCPSPCTSGLPEKCQGIFYMRGNPMPDDLVTLERVEYNPVTRQLSLPFAGQWCWSAHPNMAGKLILLMSRVVNYRYIFNFSEDFNEIEIGMTLCCLTVPSCLLLFRMDDVSPNKDGSLWERWSVVLGRAKPSYWAEKVVDADRQPTRYMKNVVKECAKDCFTKNRNW